MYSRYTGTQGVDENINCLVAGCTNRTLFMASSFPFFMFIFSFFKSFEQFLEKILLFIIAFQQIRPLYLLPLTLIEINEGTGWLYTVGKNGTKSWNGTLIGRYEEANKWAILGFAGLNIVLDYNGWSDLFTYHRHFYLGFAQQVIIEEIE